MARTPARSPAVKSMATDPGHEQRVRERAYHLWEADGKPHGRDVDYWERARELVGAEESGAGSAPPGTSRPPRRTGIDEAEAKAGESPDRLADETPVKTAPAAKRRSRATPKKPA